MVDTNRDLMRLSLISNLRRVSVFLDPPEMGWRSGVDVGVVPGDGAGGCWVRVMPATLRMSLDHRFCLLGAFWWEGNSPAAALH